MADAEVALQHPHQLQHQHTHHQNLIQAAAMDQEKEQRQKSPERAQYEPPKQLSSPFQQKQVEEQREKQPMSPVRLEKQPMSPVRLEKQPMSPVHLPPQLPPPQQTPHQSKNASLPETTSHSEKKNEDKSEGSHSPKRNNNEAESREVCKDAGTWSSQATASLLDVFLEKRLAINGRNFRGEEWEELALGVNERCRFTESCKDWKSAKQCSYKMSNLKRKYKSEKEMLQLSGSGSGWPWFSRMEAIFAADPKYASYSAQKANEGGILARLGNVQTLDHYDNDGAENTTEDPNSCSLPPSKSASTTNLDCSPSPPRRDVPAESSPHSNMCEMREMPSVHLEKPPPKKQCITMSSSFDTLPMNFNESMKIMAMQQRETLQLLRELIASKMHQRHEHDSLEGITKREVTELRQMIDSVERDLLPLKQLCEKKEKELKEALTTYEEKNRMKNELVNKLMEILTAKDRTRMRNMFEFERNYEAMHRYHDMAH